MNLNFIKKLLVFSVVFIMSLVVFAASALVLYFTGNSGVTAEKSNVPLTSEIAETKKEEQQPETVKSESTNSEKEQTVVADNNAFCVAVICDAGDNEVLCAVTVDAEFKNAKTTAIKNETVESKGANLRIGELLEKRSIPEFLSACSKTARKSIKKYIKFDYKNFIKTTDRFGGIMYNDNDEKITLSGNQAAEKLFEEGFFENAVQDLIKSFVLGRSGYGYMSDFLFLKDNVETNLSYVDYVDYIN